MSHLSAVPSDPDQLLAWLQQQGLSAAEQFIADVLENRIDLPDPPRTVQELTVKVTLRGAKPPIWRRLVVTGDTTLEEFHDVLQTALGWSDSHLHRFYPTTDDRGAYFLTGYDEEEGDEGTREEEARLDQVLREPGDRLSYDYDFGDGWSHHVRLESVSDLSGEPLPRCTAGRKACPPEDVGGIWGHEAVATWHRAGRPADAVPEPFESVEHILDWLPVDYDPDAFDVTETDQLLRATQESRRLIEGLRPELAELLGGLDPVGSFVAAEWVAAIPEDAAAAVDLTAATEHWRVLLDAVGPGVKLTAAGYLPPAVVQQLHTNLGLADWFGKGNREDLTYPIAQLRTAAQHIGLLRKAKGSLTPTAKARRVASDPAGLFEHVSARLPAAPAGAEQDAGWFALLGLAAGVTEAALYDGVRTMLTSRGYRASDLRPVTGADARYLAASTVGAVIGPRQLDHRQDGSPGWVRQVAARVVLAP